MTNGSWWGTGPPWLHVLDPADLALAGDALPGTGTAYLARLDGASMGEVDGVFTQFRERLRFPGYFGWNWDALDDCLRDLRWVPGDAYLVVVSEAERVLADLPRERGMLLAVLARAGRSWALSGGATPGGATPGGGGVPFNVLLLCDPAHSGRLGAEIASL